MLLPLFALVATDAFASWPLLQDEFRGEESKPMNVLSWTLTAASTLAGVMAVAEPQSVEVIYPGYLLIMMGTIWICSLFNFFKKVRAR